MVVNLPSFTNLPVNHRNHEKRRWKQLPVVKNVRSIMNGKKYIEKDGQAEGK
jgi:hypothetical protein